MTGAREMVPAVDAFGSSRFAYSDNPLRGGAGGSDDGMMGKDCCAVGVVAN